MLKFGGSRPESDGTEAKDRERKQRHQRSAANPGAAAAAAVSGAPVPGNGTSGMDSNRGLGSEATPKPLHQMAPPDIPFGSGQPPVVKHIL